MLTRFYNGRILRNGKIVGGELWCHDGAIVPHQKKADKEVDLEDRILAPGYIDVQLNGAFDVDFTSNPEALQMVARQLPQFGVTSFLPTIISCHPEEYKRILPLIRRGLTSEEFAAVPLGIHLEGPLFDDEKRGCHPLVTLPYTRTSSLQQIADLYGSLEGVRMLTVSPNRLSSCAITEALAERGITVCAGHSTCSAVEVLPFVGRGLVGVTHLFNAMRSFSHREVGLPGIALVDPRLYYTLIVDGVHVAREAVRLAWLAAGSRCVLVSDGNAAIGGSNKNVRLGSLQVRRLGNRAVVAGSDALAGSVTALDECVRLLRSFTACSTAEALEAASTRPAELLGISARKGTFAIGADADLIVLDDHLQVMQSYVGGKLAWSRNS